VSRSPFAATRRDVRTFLPSGRVLPRATWEARHRAIVWLLWAHVPALLVFGAATGQPPLHALLDVQAIVLAAVAASCTRFKRGVRAGTATFGLVASSAVLVHFSGGVIEMHFHFFVVVGIITLYQDWTPFVVAIGFTVAEHGIVGVFASESVYNHAAAQRQPWVWALIHGGFVLAASVPHVLAWRHNEDQALRDPLTRLSNRTLLAEQLARAVTRGEGRHHPVAVLFVDLDYFKQVNDTLGHAVGDEVLVTCADRLRRCIRDSDLVARLGGDEFAVVLEGTTARAADEVAGRMLDAIAEPIVVGGHEVVMTASIGVAHASTTSDEQDLMRNADLAMYVAKSTGRNRYDIFDDAMHTSAVSRLELEADLRQAVARGDITIACQPIVEVASAQPSGVEVLARWTHPERGAVPPSEFIPVAERTGLIAAIGEQVFEKACVFAAELAAIDPTMTVTVNLSPVQLNDDDLPRRFEELLRAHGVAAGRIVIEVTETVLMQDVRLAAERLNELKRIGVRVAVDDFGVGHSSLSYLRNLPVDVLKIDKSFVDELPSGADVTRMMINLGRMLGLDVIAEGVESDRQRAELQSLGCRRAQGYLFAKPMPPEVLLGDLARRRVPSSRPA
jgi:diguanylate cyclase (GGDEF)-like protein